MPIAAQTINVVRYPPERLVDAEVQNITGGGAMTPPPLYLDGLSGIGKMVRIDSLATSQNANVALSVTADGKLYPPTAQPVANELNNQVADEWSVDALNTIQLNVSASSNAVNYILSYGLWVWPPSVADYILAGLALTPDQQTLANNYMPAGWTPRITPYEFIWKMYRGKKYTFAGVIPSVGATTGQPIAFDNPPAGYFDVIEEIGVDASAAGNYNLATQLTNGLLVYIERDIDKPLQSYLAAGYPWSSTYNTDTGLWFPGAARPFIVARNNWRVYLMTASGQTVTNIPYRVVIKRCPEFPVHRAHWGITAGISQDIIDQVATGVL